MHSQGKSGPPPYTCLTPAVMFWRAPSKAALVLAAARASRATSRAVASASVRAASSSAATRFSRMMSDRVSILIELVRLSARGREGAKKKYQLRILDFISTNSGSNFNIDYHSLVATEK